MSTKTLRKRISLVAVTALTAGVLSVVAAPVANANIAAQDTILPSAGELKVASGSNVTGLSTTGLGVSTAVADGSQGSMRIVDIAPYVDNNWGDSFVIVRVVNARSQYFGSVTAIV